MNRISILFFLFVFSLGVSSCKKDEPTPISSPPIFYFTGNVGSNAIALHAGENNYYMYSIFSQDVNNVYSFHGNLSTYNCTNCGNIFQLVVNDFQPSTLNGSAAIATSLSAGYYSYLIPGGAPTQFYLPFNATLQGTPQSFYWNFGDGTSSTLQNPTHTYVRPGIYRVLQSVLFSSSATDSVSYNLRFGIPQAECSGNFSTNVVGNTVTFIPNIVGTSPYTYFWDFGDGNTSTAANPSHTYANNGKYRAYLHVYDASTGEMEFAKNISTQSYTGVLCSFNSGTLNALANPMMLSNITVNWTDAAGVSYTSNHSTQPASSYFKLISVDDYSSNANGQLTKKLHLNFKCMVYSATDSLQIDNGDAVVAVAYQ